MRMRSLFLWLAATAAATAIAWAAVSQVAAQTVEPLPAGIADAERSPTAGVVTPTSAPPPTVPADGGSTPTDQADGPTPAASTTRSYDLVGGQVTVRFSPDAVDIVSVTPAPGYTIKDTNRHGPLDVEVELRAEDARSRLRTWWDDGPRHRIDEDP